MKNLTKIILLSAAISLLVLSARVYSHEESNTKSDQMMTYQDEDQHQDD